MAKRTTLLDEVLKRIPKKGFSPWHQRIPQDMLVEIESIRSAFWSGQLPARTTLTGLSHALSKSLQERGVDIGHSGVKKWLENHDKA